MWVMTGNFEGSVRLFTGCGWTERMEEAQKYDDPDKAQRVADSMHYTHCNFDLVAAKKTSSQFEVRDQDTGKLYDPPPIIENKHGFYREKR